MASTGEAGRRPALDGLRGVAILLVVLAHSYIPGTPWSGLVGVTAFFTLSGYLITGLLRGGQPLRVFYLRRAARLLPALVLVLAFAASIGVSGDRIVAAGLYVMNYWRIAGGDSAPLGHTWSLAVEEQFYLLWPAVLPMLVARRGRLAAAIGAVVAWRVVATLLGWSLVVQMDTVSNSIGLLVGAWLAVNGVRSGRRWWLPAGLVGMGAVTMLPASLPWDLMWLVVPLASVACMSAALVAAEHWTLPGWLRWLGRVSYGWYLWHELLMIQFGGSVAANLALAAISLGVAALSFYLIETPIQRWARGFRSAQPVQLRNRAGHEVAAR